MIVTCSKTSNVLLKFREGTVVGCKITLRNHSMHLFLFKLILLILPKVRQFEGLQIPAIKNDSKPFSFCIHNVSIFSNIENQYSLFVGLPKLYIHIISDCIDNIEVESLLTSQKLPFLRAL